jgi:hypothetical protein
MSFLHWNAPGDPCIARCALATGDAGEIGSHAVKPLWQSGCTKPSSEQVLDDGRRTHGWRAAAPFRCPRGGAERGFRTPPRIA